VAAQQAALPGLATHGSEDVQLVWVGVAVQQAALPGLATHGFSPRTKLATKDVVPLKVIVVTSIVGSSTTPEPIAVQFTKL